MLIIASCMQHAGSQWRTARFLHALCPQANAGGGGDAAGEVPGCERAAAKAHSGKKKARREEEEGQKGLRPITDFFSAGQAAAAAAAAAATAGADEPENLAEDSP